jgi:hypothetical protein
LRHGFGHQGDRTSFPALRFFEQVVRDYISAFAARRHCIRQTHC